MERLSPNCLCTSQDVGSFLSVCPAHWQPGTILLRLSDNHRDDDILSGLLVLSRARIAPSVRLEVRPDKAHVCAKDLSEGEEMVAHPISMWMGSLGQRRLLERNQFL
jgi:hypothetical protein